MIPDYQTLMLPLLRIAADQAEHRIGNVIEKLGQQLKLADKELTEVLPSGERLISSRVHWAKTYLAQARLVESTRRGHFLITQRGLDVLGENPEKITLQLLRRFPEFLDFTNRRRGASPGVTEVQPSTEFIESSNKLATPDELLRTTIADLETVLAGELLDRILAAPPAFFENLIVELLLKMGYGGSREDAGRAIGKSGDGGLDGVIDQDLLGLDRVYLQAKRYKHDSGISESEVRAFSGSLTGARANKGVFVTTSYFTKPALDFAERHPFKIVLIDGRQLTSLMIRHNVGVRIVETHHLRKIDEDFFDDE